MTSGFGYDLKNVVNKVCFTKNKKERRVVKRPSSCYEFQGTDNLTFTTTETTEL